jgi:hypothetical protein
MYPGSVNVGINVYDCINMKKLFHDLESCDNLKSSGTSLYKKAQMESDIDLLRELIQSCDGL